jgi:two-component system response regulator PilR (NtrC family)
MGMETPDIDDEAIETLQNYHFPGNVRELENILERAIALSDDNCIHSQDLHLKPTSDSFDSSESAEINNDNTTDPMDLAGQERNSIMQALEQTRWNKTAAAKLLGLSLRQLRYRLQKLDIE